MGLSSECDASAKSLKLKPEGQRSPYATVCGHNSVRQFWDKAHASVAPTCIANLYCESNSASER